MGRLLLGSLAFLLLVAGILVFVVLQSGQRREKSDSLTVPDATSNGPMSSGVDTNVAPAGWMTEYTLTERSGKPFHSQELAGKVHVVNFFFSKCPTVCRNQTAAVKAIAQEFGPKGVVFLSITCDPKNDTPDALLKYATEFGAHPEHWLFLTGELNYLRRVGGEMYSLPVDIETHSEMLVVLDKWGQTRHRFSWKDGKQLVEMQQFLSQLLGETERPTVK